MEIQFSTQAIKRDKKEVLEENGKHGSRKEKDYDKDLMKAQKKASWEIAGGKDLYDGESEGKFILHFVQCKNIEWMPFLWERILNKQYGINTECNPPNVE